MTLTFAISDIAANCWFTFNVLVACSVTWESQVQFLGDIFKDLQVVDLTLKPSEMQFGLAEVKYLSHVL